MRSVPASIPKFHILILKFGKRCRLITVHPTHQGYQGLVDGGDHIKEATWESVSMMLQLVRDTGRDTGTGGHRDRGILGDRHPGWGGGEDWACSSLAPVCPSLVPV